ncbi:unnamed protein product [Mytilus coruscus]|nr:unnamed protein product [Mytilus coruscus]
MCQKQLSTRTQKETICGKCTKLAAQLCKKCSKLRCLSCYHKHKDMMRIYPLPTLSNTQKTKKIQHKMNNLYTITFEEDESPVQIYGIGYLEDGTLVALDGNNLKLIIFNSEMEQLTEVFEDEPRAITSMTGNKIAVTFPCKKLIRIYEIDVNRTNRMKLVKPISMKALGKPKLKPYSIAYNRDCFAIEIGERENGMIIIYDNTKDKILHKIQCIFAYFTGHTIRFALDMRERLLFVSAMGKRMVSCVDFENKIKWNVSNASPRSIIILEKSPFGKIIILSSRRCNTIYILNKRNGEELFLQKDISSPRYAAYNSNNKTFCVHIKNTINNEDELAFFEFQDIEECTSKSKLLP